MKTVCRISCAISVCLLLGPALLHAKEALMVFQAGQPTAGVYETSDFQLLARPVVGAGSFHAVAVPSASDPLRAGKFYVARRDSVVVLDSEFANVGTIGFGEELPRERQAITVTHDGSRLLVAAGTTVYLVDTADDSILARLDTGFRLRGIVLSANGSQAFAFSSASPIARIVDIAASRLLNAAVTLPEVPTALSGGPGGEIYAAARGGFYDLAPISLPQFQMQSISSAAARFPSATGGVLGTAGSGGEWLPGSAGAGGMSFDEIAIGPSQRFMATSGGKLYGGAIGRAGGLSVVSDPSTGLPLDRVVAITTSTVGNSVFTAIDGGTRVLKLDFDDVAPAMSLTLDSTASSIAAFTTVVEQNVFDYQKDSGDNQTVMPGTNFMLSVKAVDNLGNGVAGASIFLETQFPDDGDVPNVSCNSVLTGADGIGTITCSASDTGSAVEKTLRVNGLSFRVTITTGGNALGTLVKLSQEFQLIGPRDGFNLRVEARDAEGNLQPNVTLFATVNLDREYLTCYDKVITGVVGQANFICYTGDIPSAETLLMTITDRMGRSVIYSILLSPTAVVEGLKIVSGDFGEIPQNSTFELAVQSNDNNGFPRPNFTLTVTTTPGSPTLTCPPTIVTDAAGRAIFSCSTGNVSVQTTAFITVSDGQTPVVFYETLKPGTSNAPGLSKVSGDNQVVLKNAPIQLVVQANNASGDPRPNAILSVSKNVGNSVATCPAQVNADGSGRVTITCTAGNVASQSSVQVTVNDNQGSQVVFSVTILPAVTTSGGFRKVSGDNQVTIPNVALSQPLVVESLLDGVPQANGIFTVTTSPSNRLLCTSTVTANSQGRGSIFCSASSVATVTEVSVFVTDNLGRSLEQPFKVTVVPGNSTPPENLSLLTSASITGGAGATLENAVTVKATDSEGDAKAGLVIVFSSAQGAAMSPPADVTNSDGLARTSVTLGCTPGTIRAQSPSGGPEVSVSYTVTAGAAGAMTKVQGDNQTGGRGQLLSAKALVVRLADICGTSASRVPVGWSVDPPNAATLVNTIGVSDGSGRSSTLVRLGNRPGPLTITATSGLLSAVFNLTVEAGVPSAPLAGFVNAASYQPGWVPGSAGAIFGTGLMDGINGVVSADSVPFPTIFRGVRVLVNGVPAPIIHLINVDGAEQINLQVPFQTATGTATVVIENNDRSATISGVPILAVQPGMFANPANGFAAALHASTFQPVTAANPARPNEIIALFLTGLGAVNPAVATNEAGPVPPAIPLVNVVVGIDNAGMETLGAFYAPGLRTAYQINFRVAANVQSGNRKLAVVAGGVAAVDAVLPVQR